MAPKKPARKATPAKKTSSGSRAAAKKQVPVKKATTAGKKATKAASTKTRAKKPSAKKPSAKKKAPAKKPPAQKKAPTTKAPAKKAKATATKAEAKATKAPSTNAPAKATKATKTAAEAEKKPVSSVFIREVPPRKPGSVICPLSGFEVMPQPPNLSDKTVERLQKKLTAERERHLRQADELEAEAEALALERDPGDTQFDEESGEGDTMNVERERDLVLSASARTIVDSIDRALDRIKKGTYGLCVPAGRRIALERLEAIPYAEECVDCKARAERRR
jgi:RNA polymerase-binding transcription factor DksA